MKLLVITQKVNKEDGNLGFFHDWLLEFAAQVGQLTVICLEQRSHSLPKNVRVLSLGKEKGVSKGGYIWNFYRYIWQERDHYDAVFVHMNPEYLVLGGLLWRLWGKRIALWYTHHSITWQLRVGVQFADMIFSAARESFRLKTHKPVVVLGHGISLDRFSANTHAVQKPPVLLVDARISRSKHLETILDISHLLLKRGIAHSCNVVGAAITADDLAYKAELQSRIHREALPVALCGAIPFLELPRYYADADVFLNLANVGGLNKVPLQAMAANLFVLTSNEAYRGILPDEHIIAPDPESFVVQIQKYLQHPVPMTYRSIIIRDHSLPQLVKKIVSHL